MALLYYPLDPVKLMVDRWSLIQKPLRMLHEMLLLSAQQARPGASALARNLLGASVFPESGEDQYRSLTFFRYRAEV